MGLGVLRSKRQDLLAVNQTISSTTQTNTVDLGSIEGSFSVQVVWTNGTAVNMALTVELSNDSTNFVPITATSQTITSASGTHMFDMQTGAEFLRVAITVTGGSADFSIYLNGKSR